MGDFRKNIHLETDEPVNELTSAACGRVDGGAIVSLLDFDEAWKNLTPVCAECARKFLDIITDGSQRAIVVES